MPKQQNDKKTLNLSPLKDEVAKLSILALDPLSDPLSLLLLRRFRLFLFQSHLRCPRTTLHYLEITLDPIRTEFVWMWTLTSSSEHSVLVDGVVELGVIREKDRGTRSGGFCRHVLLRVDVGLEILDARIRRIVHKIESGATRIRNVDRLAAV